MRDPGFVETPVRFGRHESLVGTICAPAEAADPDAPVLVFINAGIIHRSGPNRFYVSLARSLAEAGIRSLRFDLSGVGDSVVAPGAPARSLRERVEDDLDDVVELLRNRLSARRSILLGLCSGADHAAWNMGRLPDIVGAILLDVNVSRTPGYYVRYYGRRLLSPRLWFSVLTGRHPLVRGVARRLTGGRAVEVFPVASPTFTTSLSSGALREAMGKAVARNERVLAVFTGGVEAHYNHQGQFRSLLRPLDVGDTLTELFRPECDHTFSRPEFQDWLTATTVQWIQETPFPFPPDTPSNDSAPGPSKPA